MVWLLRSEKVKMRSTKSDPGRWIWDLSMVLHWWERRDSAFDPRIDSISASERDIAMVVIVADS